MLVLEIILLVLVTIVCLLFIIYLLEPSLLAIPFSLLLKIFFKNPPIVDKAQYFPQFELFEENWITIREELKMVMEHEESIPKFHEVDNVQRFISAKDNVPWRTFIFKAYDNWMHENCELAPQTTALIKQIPEVTTAMFSILGPHKHIPLHYGFYKGIFRYHLGIVIPKNGECYIVNGGQKYTWEEGESVLFDDTFQHAVWNNSEETRVVLFCDVFRSDLPPFFNKINRWVYKQRVNSKRLKKAVSKAEVQVDLKPQVIPE